MVLYLCYIVALTMLSFSWIFLPIICSGLGNDEHIWLTVSSTIKRKTVFSTNFTQRLLEFNWNKIPISEVTWLGLFDENVGQVVEKSKALFSLDKLDNSFGSYRTNIPFPLFAFVNSSLTSGCLKYYMVWAEADQVKKVNCIRSQPFWMSENSALLVDKPVNRLMLPGTHNSGSYSIGYEPGLISKLLNAYSLCQDEPVLNQLVYGNRYLDIRVMYSPHNGHDFWIAHDVYPIDITLKEVLEQVKLFLDSSQGEVVILDFHRFPFGFEKNGQIMINRHRKLLEMLELVLGSHIAENTQGYTVSVGNLVKSGRRLIVGHAEHEKLSDKSYLFPEVKQLWANTDNIEALKDYFNRTCCSNGHTAEAAMAQLTPVASKLLTYGGLRKLAQDVNHLVTKWFRDSWMNQCANIVATDYFLGNNMIEIAINSNKKRN